MWDKPDVMNRVSSVLIAAACALAAFGALHYLVRLPVFALRELVVEGPIAHVTRAQVEVIAARQVAGNFFTLDLNAARAAFEKLPWVRTVTVRRQWPDRLEVAIEEHMPLARWGNTALVNTYGELFIAAYDGSLPVFVGPEGTSKEIAIQFDYFRRSLAAIRQTPVQVQVTARRAWQLRLASGLIIELGRENTEARLDRFVKVYDRTLARLQRRLEYVDLRYPNGFALRVPGFDTKPRDGGQGASNTKRG